MNTFALKKDRGSAICYRDFADAAEIICDITREFRPEVHIQIRCDQRTSYYLRGHSFCVVMHDGIWHQSNKLELILTENESNRMHFSFTMMHDRTGETGTLFFDERCIEADLSLAIKEGLVDLRRRFKLADGYRALPTKAAFGSAPNFFI
jgi:hypothetical protein